MIGDQIIAGKNDPFFNADDYGTHESEAALDAAITACVAAGGGTVYVPTGNWAITNACPTISVGLSILGDGPGSVITTSATNVNVFNVVTTSSVNIEGLYIVGPGVGTSAACGIYVGLPSGSNVHSSFRNLVVEGFFYGVFFEDASLWQLDHCYIVNNYVGTLIQNADAFDAGDSIITSCTYDSSETSHSAVYIQSGGGLKIVATKILRHNYGIYVNPIAGVTTSILPITGCSIENQVNACVYATNTSTGVFYYVQLTGCQLANSTYGVLLSPSDGANIPYTSIVGNIFNGAPIYITKGTGVNIVGNCLISSNITNVGGTYVRIDGNSLISSSVTGEITGILNNSGTMQYRNTSGSWTNIS